MQLRWSMSTCPRNLRRSTGGVARKMVLSRLHSHHRDCTATVAMVAQPPPVKFHIAPMQCYTNRHLRDLLGRLCPAAVLWTEMEKTTDLATEAARHRRLWHRQTERPVVLQLGGDDPAQLAAAVRHAAPYGYSELNLNCGCPSVEAGGADFGAALMRRPDATRRMLEEMAAAAGGVPVSLKCRVGTHDRPAGSAAPPTDEYEPLAEFVQAVSRSGAVRRRSLHRPFHPAVHSADSASHSAFYSAFFSGFPQRIHSASLLRCSTWRCTHAPQCSRACHPCTPGGCRRCGPSWWRASRLTSRRQWRLQPYGAEA